MIRKFYSFLILATIALVGCVDSDYDLMSASTDGINFGSSSTVFTLPIGTITFTSSDLDNTSNDPKSVVSTTRTDYANLSLLEMLDLANAFLPADTDIDIAELTNSEELDDDSGYSTASEKYIAELTTALLGELEEDEDKAAELAEILSSPTDYGLTDNDVSGIFDVLEVDSNAELDAITSAIQTAASENADQLTSAITTTLSDNVVTEISSYSNMSINESIDSVDVEEIFDFINSGEIRLIATYECDFPFVLNIDDLTLTSSKNNQLSVKFTITEGNVVNNGDVVDLDDLSTILEDGAMVTSDINLETYTTVSTSDDDALRIKLVLKKFGAISL